jgi:hypothetical protein
MFLLLTGYRAGPFHHWRYFHLLDMTKQREWRIHGTSGRCAETLGRVAGLGINDSRSGNKSVAGTPMFLLLTGYRAGPFHHWRYFHLLDMTKQQKKEESVEGSEPPSQS